MKKYLVISNDKINIKRRKISSEFNDVINILNAVQKKNEIFLYSRKSKSVGIFGTYVKKKISRIDLFTIFKLKKVNILMISITPRNFFFLLFSNFIFRDIKGFVLLRSNGHKEYETKFGKIGFWFYNLMFDYVIKRLKIISVSKDITKKKIHKYLFPSELDQDWFKKRKKLKKNSPSLLYVGRFRKEKGVYSLIQLVNNLNLKFKLTLAGDNKKLFTQNKKISILSNVLNKKKIIKLYDNHNIFILPSFTEGSPKVIIESLARLRPVIVFKEIKHVKSNFKGVFVCDRNIISFKNKISYILENYSKIQIDMKKNNLLTKKKFQENLIKILND